MVFVFVGYASFTLGYVGVCSIIRLGKPRRGGPAPGVGIWRSGQSITEEEAGGGLHSFLPPTREQFFSPILEIWQSQSWLYIPHVELPRTPG